MFTPGIQEMRLVNRKGCVLKTRRTLLPILYFAPKRSLQHRHFAEFSDYIDINFVFLHILDMYF